MNKIKVTGTTWNKLSVAERSQIQEQMPKLIYDANMENYRYYYNSNYKCWTIINAFDFPMSTNGMKGVSYGK